MNPWALVTPSNRGIGLQLARRILQITSIPVVATARKDLDRTREQLCQGLPDNVEGRLSVLRLDVLDEDSIAQAAVDCKSLFDPADNYLHMAFAVPGLLFPEKSPKQINHDDALLTLRTNTLGPMLLLKHFSEFLPKKAVRLQHAPGLPDQAVWATMSARVGSIADNSLGGWYSYRASKAAVNQVTKTFDNHLRTSSGDNAIAISMHPGTVKTEFSKEFWSNVKPGKLFEPEHAAEKLVDVVVKTDKSSRGKCWDWKGEEVPP